MLSSKTILISGKQASGKTTLAKALADLAEKKKWLVYEMKFADALYKFHDFIRDELRGLGIDAPQKDGLLLQLLGTDWGRKKYGPNIWADLARRTVLDKMTFWETGRVGNPKMLFIFDDARFPNELEIFPVAHRVRLECSPETRKKRCPAWRDDENHPSEVSLDNYNLFDATYCTDENGLLPEQIVEKIDNEFLSK